MRHRYPLEVVCFLFFAYELCQIFRKKEIVFTVSRKTSRKLKIKQKTLQHSQRAVFTLILRADRGIRKENYRPVGEVTRLLGR